MKLNIKFHEILRISSRANSALSRHFAEIVKVCVEYPKICKFIKAEFEIFHETNTFLYLCRRKQKRRKSSDRKLEILPTLKKCISIFNYWKEIRRNKEEIK